MSAREYFKDNLIIESCDIDVVHELFIKVYLEYNMVLENSIMSLQNRNILKSCSRNYYNYILIDADLLYRLVDSFNDSKLGLRSITMEDMIRFKQAIIYIGKYSHLREAFKKLLEGNLDISNKNSRIANIWNRDGGIIPIQMLSDSGNFLAISREYSMIKTTGEHLTNVIIGSVHGIMKNEWTSTEVRKFLRMLLYFYFYQCLIERPIPTYTYMT